MNKYRNLGWLVAVWFLLALGASALQLFRNDTHAWALRWPSPRCCRLWCSPCGSYCPRDFERL